MEKQIKCLIMINILIFGILIIPWNIESNADIINNRVEELLTLHSNSNSRSNNFEWGTTEVISEPIFGQNHNFDYSNSPDIAIEDDKVHVVWDDSSDFKGSGSDYDIFYRYFNGNVWSDIQIISEPISGQNINTEDSRGPDIVVENGKIFVVWQDQNNTNNAGTDWDIFYRCNITGNGWEDIQVISEPIHGQNSNTDPSYISRIIIENGKIFVTWDDFTNLNGAGTNSDIFFRCNLSGSAWEPVQVISEPVAGKDFSTVGSGGSQIDVENGKIYVTWTSGNNTNNASSTGPNFDIFYRCNLSGYSWEPIQVISEPIFGKDYNLDARSSSIMVENGKIYVVWESENNTYNSGEDFDIFFRSNLTGSNWGNIEVISEPSQGVNFNIGGSIEPEIAIENGRIYVIWRDQNNTNNANGGLFYRCKFNDHFWEPIQVISEPIEGKDFNIGFSHAPDIVVNLGKCHLIWEDNNNTNNAGTDDDIFYRWIKDPSPLFLNQPSVSPIIGNTSTNFDFTITYFNYDNVAPMKITVNISGTEYLMHELESADTNFIDGKEYFFNIKNLEIGIHSYKFYTADGRFIWSSKLVNKPIVYNTAPKIITEDDLAALEDVYYEVYYEYEDIDVGNVDQVVTWNFSTDAEWLKFDNSTAMLNGTPTNDDVGEYWINISISDTIDSDFTNFTLTVINVNDAPIITTKNIESVNEDELYDVEYKAFDIDSSIELTNWTMITNASWLDFQSNNAILSGIPKNEDVGEYWVNITVSDGLKIDYTNFTLQVININDPPRIITSKITNAKEDEYFDFMFEAIDVDNSASDLFWTITSNANWLVIDNANQKISGTPANDDVGSYWINLSVTDIELTDYSNLSLTVENTNDPPKIIIDEKGEIQAGELYSVHFRVEDIDPPPLSFIWSIETNSSDWLSIDQYTGLLIGNPSDEDVGSFWVNVSVSDNEGDWDFYNYSILVKKRPIQNITQDPIPKDEDGTPFYTSESFFGIFIIFLIIIILISVILIFTLQKQKKEVITIIREQRAEVLHTVKAELINPSTSIPAILPETKPGVREDGPLPSPKLVSEQLPAPASLEPQYQLPKATLSKAQRLELLEERFLRGEVDLETYKELKVKIEGQGNGDITKGELEKETSTSEQQQPEVIKEPTIANNSQTKTSEQVPVNKRQEQVPAEPELSEPQESIQSQSAQTEPTTPSQQQKPTGKEHTDEK